MRYLKKLWIVASLSSTSDFLQTTRLAVHAGLPKICIKNYQNGIKTCSQPGHKRLRRRSLRLLAWQHMREQCQIISLPFRNCLCFHQIKQAGISFPWMASYRRASGNYQSFESHDTGPCSRPDSRWVLVKKKQIGSWRVKDGERGTQEKHAIKIQFKQQEATRNEQRNKPIRKIANLIRSYQIYDQCNKLIYVNLDLSAMQAEP